MTWTAARIRSAAATIDLLNRIICDMQDITYTATATAPDTWDALQRSAKWGDQGAAFDYDWHALRHREVWNGASDKTIFATDEQNFRARAVHDYVHLLTGNGFTPDGERATCKAQVELMRSAGTFFSDLSDAIAVVRAEVAGQVDYNESHGGAFPDDQLQFDLDYLNGIDPADMA